MKYIVMYIVWEALSIGPNIYYNFLLGIPYLLSFIDSIFWIIAIINGRKAIN